MRPGSWIGVLAVLLVAALCVRLGVWQLGRWHEKRAQGAAAVRALEAPPLALATARVPLEEVRGRRVEVRGRYDPGRHVALLGRAYEGSPGVDLVTALVLADSSAVLVDRGWLYAGDGATAHPEEHPEPGERSVVGIAEEIGRGAGGPAWRRRAAESLAVWSARRLDRDSLAQRWPYALAPFVVRQLPGPGIPATPRRRAAERPDPFVHLSYAIQWFLFAGILLVGSGLLLRSRRRARAPSPLEAGRFGSP